MGLAARCLALVVVVLQWMADGMRGRCGAGIGSDAKRFVWGRESAIKFGERSFWSCTTSGIVVWAMLLVECGDGPFETTRIENAQYATTLVMGHILFDF